MRRTFAQWYVALSKAVFSGLLRAMPLMSMLTMVISSLAEIVVTVDAPQFMMSYCAASTTTGAPATTASRQTSAARVHRADLVNIGFSSRLVLFRSTACECRDEQTEE